MNASIANALDNVPAFNGRQPGIFTTILQISAVAVGSSEQIKTSLSTSCPSFQSSVAGKC